MSKFSGKADFCIHLWIGAETEEEAFNKFNGTKLYISQPLPEDFDFNKALKEKTNIPETYYKKVEYSSMKDLIPYYPYLISFAGCDNTDSRNSVVCLTSESFVDREERESLEFKLKEILRIYNRCKRKKIEFNVDDAVEQICWMGWNKVAVTELANRVKEKGKRATTDGIHLTMHERYRRELVDEMIKHDIDPAKYGYSRFVNKEV